MDAGSEMVPWFAVHLIPIQNAVKLACLSFRFQVIIRETTDHFDASRHVDQKPVKSNKLFVKLYVCHRTSRRH